MSSMTPTLYDIVYPGGKIKFPNAYIEVFMIRGGSYAGRGGNGSSCRCIIKILT